MMNFRSVPKEWESPWQEREIVAVELDGVVYSIDRTPIKQVVMQKTDPNVQGMTAITSPRYVIDEVYHSVYRVCLIDDNGRIEYSEYCIHYKGDFQTEEIIGEYKKQTDALSEIKRQEDDGWSLATPSFS